MSRLLLALALLTATAPAAGAQTVGTPVTLDVSSSQPAGAVDHTTPLDPDATTFAMPTLSPAEATVQKTIDADGVHVVHFWAPWCDNSTSELAGGWYEAIENHPEVTFTFVTLWNGDAVGDETLDRYAIPDRVVRLMVPAEQPPKGERSTTFLGLPVTWIPSTWIFNRNGQLATAFNYGEVSPETLTTALYGAASDWPH